MDLTKPASGPEAAPPPRGAPQRVVKIRRDYNEWVARETLEDYALRFTPRSFRKWSRWRVANTAFGAASFLILEALGATLLVQYGFVNAFWAIVVTGLVIFLAGLPISVYAARHGLDMDLLTRGAGFGYIGSTITSLIYATFTFIFFALEAAVMAYALELAFGIPPSWGYLICALVVVPLVTHGVTIIGRLQVWTQPLWLVMLVVPYVYVFQHNPDVLSGLVTYAGGDGQQAGFDWLAFGAATTVGIALITQMGEQVDYLRFMPERTRATRLRWWAAVLAGGPGWVVLGVVKMLGGALLAYLVITHMVPLERAVDPNQMYLAAYEYVFSDYRWAVAATALFVIVSQLKINVTNAYAGSLAWSNFFSRLTHSHPGRVVWVVFNVLIALMLMELNVFQALGEVLGLYANLAIAWIMAVVADLVVNKPLGLSPRGIEFRRAYLYDVNPVGVVAMGAASVLSVAAHLGLFGATAQAYSAAIALVTAFVVSPLMAWATRGRYYIARHPVAPAAEMSGDPAPPAGSGTATTDAATGSYRTLRCVICERLYEPDDMAQCPAYQGAICSLCCTLDARCHDLCKPHARLSTQWAGWMQRRLPARWLPHMRSGLGAYLLLMLAIVPLLAAMFAVLYHLEMRALGEQAQALAPALRLSFVKAYAALLVVAAIVAWWLVLAHRSRQVAQEESNRQTQLLMQEIDSHRRTDEALQQAKRQADQANQAKSRYITAISHELRTPLNSILGYAQLLEEDDAMPAHRRQAVRVIRRGGDHLLSLIEGTLDLARIEGGRLALDMRPLRFREFVAELARMFELQAAGKGIGFRHEIEGSVPDAVRADERRLRQILLNVLGNAVKFTARGEVVFRLHYAREMARFEVEDTGPGMTPAELTRIFEPFERGSASGAAAVGGTGLGLTIAKMLTDLMGGELSVRSTPGVGTCFTVRIFLPGVAGEPPPAATPLRRRGYLGPRRRVLVVDNEEVDRTLLARVLQPLGFELCEAASGEEGLARLQSWPADAVFMDLAMPGMDGWEAVRRMRRDALSDAPVAIVSANAFDQGLDNDVGIGPGDFFVKPVRVDELLDWLGRRLSLRWVEVPAAAAPDRLPGPPTAAAVMAAARMDTLVYPGAVQLGALQAALRLGHVRGIVRQLDAIVACDEACRPFVDVVRALTREFRFDAIQQLLSQAPHDPSPT